MLDLSPLNSFITTSSADMVIPTTHCETYYESNRWTNLRKTVLDKYRVQELPSDTNHKATQKHNLWTCAVPKLFKDMVPK